MMVSEILMKMIHLSEGNLHDINHFMKVYAFAKLIGEQERLGAVERNVLEISAIIHDIACPLCREKYGNTKPSHQEREGALLAKEFLQAFAIPETEKERIVFLVGHHHTLDGVEGLDYQILIEADYLVNAEEWHYTTEEIARMCKEVFRTETGIALLQSMYGLTKE